MCGFANHLLLDSWTENKFRKQTRVKYIPSNFCVRGWNPAWSKKVLTLGLM